MYVHACTCAHVHACTHTRARAHAHTHTCTHTHTHTDTNTHIQKAWVCTSVPAIYTLEDKPLPKLKAIYVGAAHLHHKLFWTLCSHLSSLNAHSIGLPTALSQSHHS